jgi:hypothetical protein
MGDTGRCDGNAPRESSLADLALFLGAEYLAVLAAFLDESLQQDYGVFAVAGYIFKPDGSQRLKKRWNEVLNSYDPPLTRFHMTDFESSLGEFDGWEQPKRHDLLDRLAKIIHASAWIQIGVVVDLQAFAALSASDRAMLSTGLVEPTPYAYAALHFMGSASNVIVEGQAEGESVAFVLDNVPSKQGAPRITSEFEFVRDHPEIAAEFADKWHSVTWARSDKTPEIQAADILVYEYAKEYARRIRRHRRRVRFSWTLLTEGIHEKNRRERILDAERLAHDVEYNRKHSPDEWKAFRGSV